MTSEMLVVRYLPVPPLRLPAVPDPRLRLQVYPNPAAETITVSWSGAKPGPVTLRLTDAAGRPVPVDAGESTFAGGTHSLVVALPDELPRGIYYVTVATPEGSGTVQVLK